MATRRWVTLFSICDSCCCGCLLSNWFTTDHDCLSLTFCLALPPFDRLELVEARNWGSSDAIVAVTAALRVWLSNAVCMLNLFLRVCVG